MEHRDTTLLRLNVDGLRGDIVTNRAARGNPWVTRDRKIPGKSIGNHGIFLCFPHKI